MAELLSKDMLADLAINIVNILVLFFVTRALLYKPVKKYLAARKEKAAAAAEEARAAKEQADAEKAKYEALLADAIGIPVDCPVTAGEGGAWGIAVLAAYRAHVLAGGIMPLVDFIETVRH